LDEVDAFERLSTEGHDLEEMYEEMFEGQKPRRSGGR
jgi:hypothetical protein